MGHVTGGVEGDAPEPLPPGSLLPRGDAGRPGADDAALGETEGALRIALESLAEPVGLYRAIRDGEGEIVDFRIVFVNDAACAQTRIPRDEQVGRLLLDVFPANDEVGLLDHYRRVVEDRVPYRAVGLEYDDPEAGDGLRATYDIQAVPWGEGFLATWRDHEPLVERLTPEESRLLEIVTRKAPVVLFVVDSDGVFHLSEGSGLEALGLESGEVVGRSVFDLYGEYPDVLDAVRRALEGETVHTVHRLKGAVFDTKYAPLLDERTGEVEGLVGLATNVSERAAAEAYAESRETFYRALVENSSEIFSVLEPDGSVRYQSENIRRILGHAPEDVVGTEVFDYLHPDDVDAARDAFEALTEKPGESMPTRVRFEHADGSWRVLAGEVRNLLEDPVIAGLVCNYTDVTELREREKGFRARERMLALGRLAGGVAHDFNNLLTVMKGNLQLLLTDGEELPPGHGSALREIESAADRATALTRQLLTFSSGRVSETPEISEIGEVVGRLETLLRRVVGPDVALDVTVDPGLRVEIDATHVEQVLMNLALNARDAMPSGGTVSIVARRVTVDEPYTGSHQDIPRGRYVQLVVSDTGTGIPKEDQPQIFEPFFTTKSEGEGTGLGLATIWGIVQEAGGAIHLYSEEGRGTAFRIYLPEVTEGPERELPEGGADAEEGPRVEGITGTVLVADDDPAVLSVVRRSLGRLGVELVEASDGEEALRLAREAAEEGRDIDLLMTDLMMPGLTGPDLARAIREIRPDLPVILASGYAARQVRDEAAELEGVHILEKPFELSELVRVVCDLLETCRRPGEEPA